MVNKLSALTKRIINKKVYPILLILLLALALIYRMIPGSEKGTEIIVGICVDDKSSEHYQPFMDKMNEANSLYEFEYVDSEDELKKKVQNNTFESGVYIPKGFFADFIKGDNKANNTRIKCYTSPSSTFGNVTLDSVYVAVFTSINEDILCDIYPVDGQEDKLRERYDKYAHGDRVFSLVDITQEEYEYESKIYDINIPVFELSLILVMLSALFGLLAFMKDNERGIYLGLVKMKQFEIKSLTVLSYVIPTVVSGLVANAISYAGKTGGEYLLKAGYVLLTAAIAFAVSFLLNLIIKKSNLLTKLLPLLILLECFIVLI